MSGMTIPGYRYGDPSLPPSPVSLEDLERLKAALLFTDDDVRALREAGDILAPRVEDILDVWYGFVGSHDFLLAYFSTPDGPDANYLARVRARFGQWILDTCRAEYDASWLAYQEESPARRRSFTSAISTRWSTPSMRRSGPSWSRARRIPPRSSRCIRPG